jgi:LuxR family maltose regulon positive regulatory protein
MGSKADLETPVGRRHIIERPRLTRLLDETSARVIMLVAAAGYGKTTLARQWLANRPHAWCEASTGSADVAALALNLASAASTMCPTPSRNVADWLRSTPEPEKQVKVAAKFLGEHFNEWLTMVLAIDDYHGLRPPLPGAGGINARWRRRSAFDY